MKGLLIAVCVFFTSAFSPALEAGQTPVAQIQGIVVRAGTSDGLSKATVELRTEGNNPVTLDSVTTESDGRFAFPSIRPGRYQLAVTRAGFFRTPLSITLRASQPASDIRLAMTPTGSISGRVYDSNNEPFGNIEVQALKASYQNGRRTLTPAQAVSTNDLGEYRLFWLPPGRYYVAVVHPEGQGLFRRMLLTHGGSTGTSTRSGPNGFFAVTTAGDPALEVYRDENVSGPATPRYVPLYFPGTPEERSAGVIDLRAGADFGGVNLVVTPVRARTVRGFVVDAAGKPAQNAAVQVAAEGPRLNDQRIQIDPGTGAFQASLLPGSHTFVATAGVGNGYADVQVRDADIEDVTIVTMPSFDIAGRISIEGGNAGTADLQALRIYLQRDPPVPGEATLGSYSHPLPDGSITLGAGGGDFRVNVIPILSWGVGPLAGPPGMVVPGSLDGAYVKSIRLGNTDALNTTLHLERPPGTPLEIVIGTNPGTLEGNAANRAEQPVADASVVLVPNVRSRTDLFKMTVSDSSGRFRFDGVPPGEYKLFGWQEVENGAWFDPDFLASNEARGVAIRISEGSGESAKITLD